MGIFKDMADRVAALQLPRGFSVCELGAQQMADGKVGTPAEDFYRAIGCGRYVSIDANGQGTVTADLNQPLNIGANTEHLLDQFDLVTDFGTGEHIFDQAQVWRTLHELTKPGGYLVIDRPAQGYSKHCFYLVNACLLSDLVAANGYRIIASLETKTPRGVLLRGVFQRPIQDKPFAVPHQGRYVASSQLPVGVS